MQIFIKCFDGKIITLDVEPSDTIKNIKGKLAHKKGIRPDLFRLQYIGKSLEGMALSDYGIEKNATIFLLLRIAGGWTGYAPLYFNDLSSEKIVQFSSDAPVYCTISAGLTLEGECMNPICKAYGQSIYI